MYKVVYRTAQQPRERCKLAPVRSCQTATKLVPSLKPVKDCVAVPTEVSKRGEVHTGQSVLQVCSRQRRPRVVSRPVVRTTCNITGNTGTQYRR